MNIYRCKYCMVEKDTSCFRQDKYHKLGHRKRCKNCDKIIKQLKKFTHSLNCDDKLDFFFDLYFSSLNLMNKEWASIFQCDLKVIHQILHQNDIKKCVRCGVIKSLSEFYSSPIKTNSDGFHSYCIDCYLFQVDYERMNNISTKWYKNKYQTDIKFRLRIRMSNSIYRALLDKKSNSWLDCVPYTLEDLKQHLESQFDENMSWDNYGSYWEIDHIKPVSLFNFIDLFDDEFQECWSLSNLQPLYWLDNRRKSNKY